MTTYQYIQAGGVENYNKYRPGGFHPVHLGDKFKDGRYTAVTKLGYGSFSTVWLVRDEWQGSLASLKILCADMPESSGTELDVLRRLAAGEGEGKRFILQFLDSFVHRGPNGEHLCVVTEVSGPNLTEVADDMDGLTPELGRRFVLQLARGMEYLHSCGVVHGDIHIGNMLYHLPALPLITSSEDVERFFGTPETLPIRLWEGRSPLFEPSHLPRYAVRSPNPELFLDHLLQDPSLAELKICDFSESSLHDPSAPFHGTKRTVNSPRIHAAPELIFDNVVSPASDIWALGNVMHQIMTGGGGGGSVTAIPGGSARSRDQVLRGMVCVLGKLPEKWWNRWETQSEFCDDEGQWEWDDTSYFRPKPLGAQINPYYLSASQKECFVKVLSGMFAYEPERRLTAHALVEELTSARWPTCSLN
ncbi:kinase-like domain-containing protein [Coprinopsis sp. MPI-PUGE-AT-0042]|nr:kinase-like domain-containing protein [Coprinopsis sp. MPI-PUGE-AT-0042]